ncbi:Apical endosomal glycoprotein [Eumeta japonica]|uniref:Apical endosomal glycoprotein n=1 Tax=Eumeta variegata TaxID=151549 RepID=A0A4C1T545_EUMVA|nr:Apical endosomal glycoprotein [Eumeta japonica]
MEKGREEYHNGPAADGFIAANVTAAVQLSHRRSDDAGQSGTTRAGCVFRSFSRRWLVESAKIGRLKYKLLEFLSLKNDAVKRQAEYATVWQGMSPETVTSWLPYLLPGRRRSAAAGWSKGYRRIEASARLEARGRDALAMLWVCACALLALAGGARAGPACSVAEFACRNARCVRLDHYCDGFDNCGDASDEPPHCTGRSRLTVPCPVFEDRTLIFFLFCAVCNRTYYGHVGATYSLQIREVTRAPFLCHLTLTAGGGVHGDIVQLTFEQFAVGRYEADALDGCPDGYMQVSELGRPFTGGSWCGVAAGPAVYFSETATVTVSVKLFHARVGVPFHFELRYKFVAQRDAVVRFGPVGAPLERGSVSPGTYCTRTYEECYRKPCRLQSPNWPGMYPRNVTCYWSVRQKDVPTCKHAMVGVRQEAAHKVHMKRSLAAALNKTRRALRAWRDCTGERDRIIFYDGPSTDDPVLLEYCGGDWLPRVVSRGPEMLVAFHSSPFSAPLHGPSTSDARIVTVPGGGSSITSTADDSSAMEPPSAASALRGFELDVDVMFTDSDSLDYAREARRCEFHVKASSAEEEAEGGGAMRGRRGTLHAPAHTLAPNTTCTWTFHGRPGDIVWIYFSSYVQYSLVEQRRIDTDPPEPPSTADRERDRDHDRERDRGKVDRTDTSPLVRLRELLRARTTPRPSPVVPALSANISAACPTSLRIWDGGGEGEPQAKLVGRYCEEGPRTCARAALANATRAPRPCTGADGVVSRAPLLALALTSRPGTATNPLSFALHYEFVDTRLGGEAYTPPTAPAAPPVLPAACARLYTRPGNITNVLWLGRGGGSRLRCVFRVEAPARHRVRLRLLAAGFGAAPACATRPHPHTGRLLIYFCLNIEKFIRLQMNSSDSQKWTLKPAPSKGNEERKRNKRNIPSPLYLLTHYSIYYLSRIQFLAKGCTNTGWLYSPVTPNQS